MVSVIFPAAGQGKRMQAGINKVLLTLAGEPILVRTLKTFSAVAEVGELIVVVAADEVAAVEEQLRKVSGLKPFQVVAGGSERQYSICNGLQQVSESADVVLVHDAARPLVTPKTIQAVIDTARDKGGAIAAVPAKNTIKVVDADGLVVDTPPRSTLWEVQTPQGFRKDILVKANEAAIVDDFLGTDDASLVERIGAPVAVVQSDYRNIKVTTPEDLLIAEAFLQCTAEDEAKSLQAAAAEAREAWLKEADK
ncbi:putative 2-C-methyl-D-erythritol 4-phosphate cytidylyltransferase [Selenomonas ruminantium subsp. lactilytica TAM6421]|uniref:2-C-methyl-D-erythritol 4-phosphate cytidylyltransferase n=1 Tax=Selenomonas ruminantium subsp. lactilytica (strain NBRC 103574 / TAM6421) TaxID=927704 RepID=I0GNY7_SELRL|nr:2-C-methyl-D-erythritol 4-phosphate cytidylyltransferase [Selenomonas ruminantium]BAL82474.1 putative 2-C-methyl-D-erythritol 4-phosphate cytidylyltransferase [Selenomonas ruminantium subsp. lactilytica TAM6421]